MLCGLPETLILKQPAQPRGSLASRLRQVLARPRSLSARATYLGRAIRGRTTRHETLEGQRVRTHAVELGPGPSCVGPGFCKAGSSQKDKSSGDTNAPDLVSSCSENGLLAVEARAPGLPSTSPEPADPRSCRDETRNVVGCPPNLPPFPERSRRRLDRPRNPATSCAG